MEMYLAVERKAGAGLPRTRLQRWVARHPVRFGVWIAIPTSLGGLLFAKEPGAVVVALAFGPVLGTLYSLMAVADRSIRAALRRRMGLDNAD
ncbi:hypothetical protein [Actinacidiphila glaucinigra]|uniref:hypothetical protein n=1 Tax=Actinacidiphila glaucinigra TaxID=235986 RepID=UPI00366B123D